MQWLRNYKLKNSLNEYSNIVGGLVLTASEVQLIQQVSIFLVLKTKGLTGI